MSKIRLRSHLGFYVCAERGGGDQVVANRYNASVWETFHATNLSRRGTILSGDRISLQAYNGQYVCAEGGGGDGIVANRDTAAAWETFTIEKTSGGGAISSGDMVALRAVDGHYCTADYGAGPQLLANRDAIGEWEKFRIEVIPESAFVLLQENSGRVPIDRSIPPEIRQVLSAIIDRLAETFENVKNRLQAGGRYDKVELLTDARCTRQSLLDTLVEQNLADRQIDLVVLGHGSPDTLYLHADERLTSALIRSLRDDAHGKGLDNLGIRMVYMCNCYGSSTNAAWLAAGARTSVGSRELNYMPEPMTTYFLNDWLAGYNAAEAAQRAYSASRTLFTPFLSRDLLDQSTPVVGGDGDASFAQPEFREHAGWALRPEGGFGTSDGGDYIRYVKEQHGDARAVEFRLELANRVTWKKIIQMPDGEGHSWDIVAEGAGGSGANGLWTHQCRNGQSLTFRKAGVLGMIRDVLALGDFAPLADQGGTRVVFRWARDA
jgi:hypothetical protein